MPAGRAGANLAATGLRLIFFHTDETTFRRRIVSECMQVVRPHRPYLRLSHRRSRDSKLSKITYLATPKVDSLQPERSRDAHTIGSIGNYSQRDRARKPPLDDATESLRTKADDPADAELYRRFRSDADDKAFELLFSRHRNALYTYLWALSGNAAVADDLSQYCWLKLIEGNNSTGYRPIRGVSIRSFLFALGRNRFIDEYKRKHAETRSESIDEHLSLAAADGNTYDEATAAESRQAIVRALEGLPVEQREVVAMWLSGFSINEMVAETAAPRDTVLSRKKYALKKLRTVFEHLGARPARGH